MPGKDLKTWSTSINKTKPPDEHGTGEVGGMWVLASFLSM